MFMVLVGGLSSVLGWSSWLGRSLALAGVSSGVIAAFATLWLPIAVIDFRRCTRETALRAAVEADLERHTRAARARECEDAVIRTRTEAVLAAGGPRMVYHPIVDMGEGTAVGYEALSRFADGMAPDRWFEDAARVGLGVEAELAAARGALGALDALPDGCYLSVNASPDTLRDPRLAEMISRSSPPRVVVELTEHAQLDDYDRYRRLIEELREMGAQLAVDDAGAGYASFRRVVDLHPDLIKIDRSLVQGVQLEPARRSLMMAFVCFARELGASLIVEGVEDRRAEMVLRQWGMRHAQGFLYGQPCGLDDLPTTSTYPRVARRRSA